MSRLLHTGLGVFVASFAVALLSATTLAQGPVQIPANTSIVVRTITEIDSRTADLSQEFGAAVDEDLVVNGSILAPRGANAILRIVEAKDAGAVRGRASLTLKLAKVEVNGYLVEVDGGEVTTESGSQGERAVKRGAAGAVIGGILGGIIGGGSGVATGAAIGGGAGVGSAVIQGEHVEVPPETRLTFTLASATPLPAGGAASSASNPASAATAASAATPAPAAPIERVIPARTFKQVQFEVVDAVGRGETLAVTLRVVNQGIDTTLSLGTTGTMVSAIDDLGHTYRTTTVTIGNQARTSDILTGVPTTLVLTFDGVKTTGGITQAHEIKRLVIQPYVGPALDSGRLEFRDVPVRK